VGLESGAWRSDGKPVTPACPFAFKEKTIALNPDTLLPRAGRSAILDLEEVGEIRIDRQCEPEGVRHRRMILDRDGFGKPGTNDPLPLYEYRRVNVAAMASYPADKKGPEGFQRSRSKRFEREVINGDIPFRDVPGIVKKRAVGTPRNHVTVGRRQAK
jgi:hypothetical protein